MINKLVVKFLNESLTVILECLPGLKKDKFLLEDRRPYKELLVLRTF